MVGGHAADLAVIFEFQQPLQREQGIQILLDQTGMNVKVIDVYVTGRRCSGQNAEDGIAPPGITPFTGLIKRFIGLEGQGGRANQGDGAIF